MVAGYVSLLCSVGEKPLEYWSKQHSQSGRIRKILDADLLENVIEIQDFEQSNGYGTSILCPSDSSQFLNIELPILVVVIKNLNLKCRLQVQVVDAQNCLHHFQFANAENEKHNSKGLICRVKVKLENGWNKLELNLSHLTQTAFKTVYAATQRLQICGNCRLRRIYFIDKHYDNQTVCPKLYNAFLDTYMLKWGIFAINKTTQTNIKRNKNKIRDNNNLRCLAKHFSGDNIKVENVTKDSGPKAIDENFLRSLQIKTDMLINDFFDRQTTKLPHALEFKQQAKLKRYAFPILTASPKPFHANIISQDVLKKISVLRTFTDTYISSEEKRKQEKTVKDIQDNWHCRYLLDKEESNSGDSSKQSTTRTMLKCKPKSLMVLSMMKPNSGEEKIVGTPKKIAEESIKYNENDTAKN
ncbi:uncharacterized protein LOC128893476 [Hylaeus anthracinus]|uniref:uncharacterized protein LOC128893476 n=1 Tax=Hylaeus anthracinus TaxID=313031 RepID=UPI0023B9DA07|nr:uncharacterized protein LOC128893476 [Hylaeus anthracinus]